MFNNEPVYTFNELTDVGVSSVPLNKVVFIKSTGITYLKVKKVTDANTTVQAAIDSGALEPKREYVISETEPTSKDKIWIKPEITNLPETVETLKDYLHLNYKHCLLALTLITQHKGLYQQDF